MMGIRGGRGKAGIHQVAEILDSPCLSCSCPVVPTSAAAGSPSRNSGSTRSPLINKRQMGRTCFSIRIFLMWLPSQHLKTLKPLEIHSDFPHFQGWDMGGRLYSPKNPALPLCPLFSFPKENVELRISNPTPISLEILPNS